jgi:hypothetical protein
MRVASVVHVEPHVEPESGAHWRLAAGVVVNEPFDVVVRLILGAVRFVAVVTA